MMTDIESLSIEFCLLGNEHDNELKLGLNVKGCGHLGNDTGN